MADQTRPLMAIPSEIVIPLGDHPTLYSACRIRLKLGDQAGGPYLMVAGENDEPDAQEGETGHEFFFESAAEIDQFAAICKQMLHTAQQIAAGQPEQG